MLYKKRVSRSRDECVPSVIKSTTQTLRSVQAMDRLILAEPLLFFLLATVFFYLAIQQPKSSLKRRVLGSFHVLSIAVSFQADPVVLSFYPGITIPFVVGLTVHTVAILLFSGHVLDLRSLALSQQARTFVRAWTSIRQLHLADHVDTPDAATMSARRASFALHRAVQGLLLWVAHHAIAVLFPLALLRLNVQPGDFAPEKQGIVPVLTQHDLLLRALVSTHWVWDTYCTLSIWHDALAVVCVAILGWDRPSEWPPLFGSVLEAHSLRRFWGVFWQRLHVTPFSSWTPPLVYRVAALRALWIFLLSAMCHAAVNWAMYRIHTVREDVWFFLVNYTLCLAETAAPAVLRRMGLTSFGKGSIPGRTVRLLGYLWVIVFFVCTVPGWQYPLVYNSLRM
ncbi:hypothetical protein F4823DRAFT_348174 [Ustulina deusta]|nr:hypothetical protein F4823DRAFT_348174 [Ustulina deusta]